MRRHFIPLSALRSSEDLHPSIITPLPQLIAFLSDVLFCRIQVSVYVQRNRLSYRTEMGLLKKFYPYSS